MLNDIVLIVAVFYCYVEWRLCSESSSLENNFYSFFFLSADKFGWPWLKIDEMLKPGKECTVR